MVEGKKGELMTTTDAPVRVNTQVVVESVGKNKRGERLVRVKAQGITSRYSMPLNLPEEMDQVAILAGDQVYAILERGGLRNGKTGQYESDYWWDLAPGGWDVPALKKAPPAFPVTRPKPSQPAKPIPPAFPVTKAKATGTVRDEPAKVASSFSATTSWADTETEKNRRIARQVALKAAASIVAATAPSPFEPGNVVSATLMLASSFNEWLEGETMDTIIVPTALAPRRRAGIGDVETGNSSADRSAPPLQRLTDSQLQLATTVQQDYPMPIAEFNARCVTVGFSPEAVHRWLGGKRLHDWIAEDPTRTNGQAWNLCLARALDENSQPDGFEDHSEEDAEEDARDSV